jgi:hypothetical protein
MPSLYSSPSSRGHAPHGLKLRTRRRLLAALYVVAALSVGWYILGISGAPEPSSSRASPRVPPPGAARTGRFALFPTALGRPRFAGGWIGGGAPAPAPPPPSPPIRAAAPPPPDSALPAHTWRKDGLLEVNMDGRHPIFDLIERAEAEWDAKLRRQSRSLDEAVAEYRRRYGRSPPKGFDRWY